jgi:glycosyltransferase involved in cell wall biosynthesis
LPNGRSKPALLERTNEGNRKLQATEALLDKAAQKEPLVSVIIPSYNHAQYLDETIQSVFDQEYPNWELIVCDDGSKDNSHEVLQKYANDPRVKLLLNKQNRGQGVILNEGIDASKGEFICFLSSDDIYFPNKLRLQVDKLQKCGDEVGFVYSQGLSFRDRESGFKPSTYNDPHTGDIFRRLILETCIFPISPMFRRSVFDLERFWEGFAAEGEAIYTRIARHCLVEYVGEPTCAMREHTYNIGRKFEIMYFENLRWWRKFIATPDLPPDVIALIKKRIAYQHRLAGLSYIRLSKEHQKGRKALLEAIRDNPAYIFDWKVLAGILMSFLPSAAEKNA